MRIKIFAGALFVAAAVALSPAAAWANHCSNFSRGAGNAVPGETERGRWFFIAPEPEFQVWVFGTPENFRNGTADALLDGTGACNAARLGGQTKGILTADTLKGIWTPECLIDAGADLGG